MTSTSAALPELVSPADPGYDDARRVWNLAADLRPAAVAVATSPEQVAAVVRHAADRGLRVVPIGTGHLAASHGDVSDAILLRTDLPHEVVVDASAQTARVNAGTVWQEVLDALAPHGLAPLSGSSHDVGVVGYTLGGGVSWLARAKGLAADHVTAIDVVTADGELVHATPDSEPDLFWALRGGGGNFGVVTSIEFRAFPIPELAGGIAIWDGAHAAAIMSTWQEYTRGAPETVTSCARIMELPPLPDIPEPLRQRPLITIDGAAIGGIEEADELLAPLRAIADPIMDTWAMMPASGMATIHMDPPQPVPGLGHHVVLDDFPQDAIGALLDAAGPGTNSPLLSVEVRHVGGAAGRVTESSGAARLQGDYLMFGVGMVMDPAAVPAINERLDRVEDAMSPWSSGRAFVNFADRGGSAEPAYDPETYARLREVRGAYDPGERFVGSMRIEAAA